MNLGVKKEKIVLLGQEKVIKMFWSVISIIIQKGIYLRYYLY